MTGPKPRAGRKPSIQITPHKTVLDAIDQLVESGLYGRSRSAAVERIVCRHIEKRWKELLHE